MRVPMAKRKSADAHSEASHKADIQELLSQFPVTGTDRTWRAEPVARRGYGAAHRIFERHFKGQLKEKNKLTQNA